MDGIGYIAHIDTSDVFNEKYLSGAYKRKLFSNDILKVIGISNLDNIDRIKRYVKQYRSSEVKILIDNDAHDIDNIKKNIFWLKGSKRNYSMVKEALNDYDISVSFEAGAAVKQYRKQRWWIFEW